MALGELIGGALQRDIFTAVMHLLSGTRDGCSIMSTESTMANDGNEPTTGKTDHGTTYDRFISVTIWGVAFVAVVLILMAIFLA